MHLWTGGFVNKNCKQNLYRPFNSFLFSFRPPIGSSWYASYMMRSLTVVRRDYSIYQRSVVRRHIATATFFPRRAVLSVPRSLLKNIVRPSIHSILICCGSSPGSITCGAKRGASYLKIFVEKKCGKLNDEKTVRILETEDERHGRSAHAEAAV